MQDSRLCKGVYTCEEDDVRVYFTYHRTVENIIILSQMKIKNIDAIIIKVTLWCYFRIAKMVPKQSWSSSLYVSSCVYWSIFCTSKTHCKGVCFWSRKKSADLNSFDRNCRILVTSSFLSFFQTFLRCGLHFLTFLHLHWALFVLNLVIVENHGRSHLWSYLG